MTRLFSMARVLAVCALAALSLSALAQTPADPRALIAEQRTALEKFARMDGVWRGPAWTILPSGVKHSITQTERVGLLLDGSIRLVEGRGYEPDGRVGFNAFGVISYSPETKSYRFRSHAQGRYGEFAIVPTDDGYVWEIAFGPMTIRYTATIKDGTFKEVGDRIVPGKEPFRMFEMTLTRVSDSDWPMGTPVSPK
jgi:hypothetical protein